MNIVVSQFNRAIRTGAIKRGCCEVCGKPNADGHHDDYSKPLNVRWLCRTHHIKEHARLRRINGIKIERKAPKERRRIVSISEIKLLMTRHDYSESDLASKVGVSEITVRRWLGDDNKPQGAASKILKKMIQKSLKTNVVQNAGA